MLRRQTRRHRYATVTTRIVNNEYRRDGDKLMTRRQKRVIRYQLMVTNQHGVVTAIVAVAKTGIDAGERRIRR